jgi:nucleoid DNA-binding protein
MLAEKEDADLSPQANRTLERMMPNTTKKTIVASIVQNTAVKPARAKRALEVVLESIKLALASGRDVDLGKKLGKLKVATRNPSRRINRNLKNQIPTIEDVHKKHPKTVRLLGGKDLSANPQPTIVHNKPEPSILIRKSVAIALPAWRRRIR